MRYWKHVRISTRLSRCVLGAVLVCAHPDGSAPRAFAQSFGAQALDPQESAVAQEFERVAGIKATAGAAFYRELRRAVGTGDRRSACAMLSFPLEHPDGDIPDAASCEARYDGLFTVSVRRAIGRQQLKELFVRRDGVIVGIGQLRFAGVCATRPCDRGDIRIVAMNTDPDLKPPDGKVLIACRLGNQALRVVADGSGGAVLRLYDESAVGGRPSEERTNGTPTPLATGLCAWRAWRFTGTPNLEVGEVACVTRRRPAPEGTLARVTKGDGASIDDSTWCAE